ncbi:MAG: hypothetical protein V4850_23305 [Myxococcota bacterium]
METAGGSIEALDFQSLTDETFLAEPGFTDPWIERLADTRP